MTGVKKTVVFAEMMISMLEGGATVPDALRVISGPGIPGPVRAISLAILEKMREGAGFSASMIRCATVRDSSVRFSNMHIAMIRASEKTGDLITVLRDIVRDMRMAIKARETLLSALLYPLSVILVALLGTLALYARGIPLFMKSGLLDDSMRDIALMGIVKALAFVFAFGGAIVVSVQRIFGNESREYTIFYILSFMTNNGIALPEALMHCNEALAEKRYRAALHFARKKINEGVSLSKAIKASGLFSPFVVGWLEIADENGKPSAVFCGLAEYFRDKDERLKEIVSRLIEPAIILITGVYLLILVVNVILPMLTLSGGLNV